MTVISSPATYTSHHTKQENADQVVTVTPKDFSITLGLNSKELGGPVPNYQRVIAEGGNATTPLVGERWTHAARPGNIQYGIQLKSGTPSFGYRNITERGDILDPETSLSTLGPSLQFSVANNLALTRFYSNLAATESVFKGQVLTGELRQTLNAIRHPFRSLRRGIDSYLDRLKRVGPKLPMRSRPRFVRDTWLEYSFGWRPLIADADNLLQAFYRSQWVKPLFKMVRSHGEYVLRSSEAAPTLSLGYGFWVSSSYVHTRSCEVKYYGVYRSRGNGVTDSSSYGFSPWEFVPTLWELIPYSFLVDYFTNAGDIVSSWSYRFLGCDWVARGRKSAHAAATAEAKLFYYADYYNPADYTHWLSGDPGQLTFERSTVLREASVPLGIPSLELQVPGMLSQWINIAALSKNLDSTRMALRP